jgi:hypothetical protein
MEDMLSEASLSGDEEAMLHKFFDQQWSINEKQVWKEMLNRWLVSWKYFSSDSGKHDGCSIYSYVESLRIRMYIEEALENSDKSTQAKIRHLIQESDKNFFRQTVKSKPILPEDSRMGEWIRYIPINPGELLRRQLVSEYRHNKVLGPDAEYDDLLHL